MLPMSGITRPFSPHCTPIALAKSLVVCTMRASTSTCGSARSSVARSWRIGPNCSGRSAMMSVLVRTSTCTCPYFDSRSEPFKQRRDLGGLGVAQWKRLECEAARLGLPFGRGLRRGLPRLVLVLERLDLRDPDDRPVNRVVEPVAAQDHVERLIPRHIRQLDVHRALHVGIDDHVQPADVGQRPQHRAQVDAIEVETQRIAGVLARLIAAGRSPGRSAPAARCRPVLRGAAWVRACGAGA